MPACDRRGRPSCRVVGLGATLLIVAAAARPSAAAGAALEVELFAGAAVNAKTPLHIFQNGWPELEFTADYETRAFDPPLYYVVRVAYRRRGQAWALDPVHHKLHLANRPEQVHHFSITHGFNLLTLGRIWDCLGATAYTGAGVVIAHPESRIREKRFPEEGGVGGYGYYVAGPVVGVGVGKRLHALERFFISVEARATLAYAFVSIEDGDARLANVAFHALAGRNLSMKVRHVESEFTGLPRPSPPALS